MWRNSDIYEHCQPQDGQNYNNNSSCESFLQILIRCISHGKELSFKMGWCTSTIPALRRLKKEDPKFWSQHGLNENFHLKKLNAFSPIILFSYEHFPCIEMENFLTMCTQRLRHTVHKFKLAKPYLKSIKPDLCHSHKDYWTGIGLAYRQKHSFYSTWSWFHEESQVV